MFDQHLNTFKSTEITRYLSSSLNKSFFEETNIRVH